MGYWITPDGSYYEGESVAEGSIEVPPRPSQFHAYVNDEWQFSVELKRASLKPLSARQVRLVLSQFNYRDAVEAGVAAAPQAVKDEWNYANDFQRNSPVLNGMAQALGISAADVDAMFEQGVLL
jgi:hypothetical protein